MEYGGEEGGLVDFTDSVRGGIVTARGTSDGLIIRVDSRVEESSLKDALREFVEARRSFLTGHEVSFEWIGGDPAAGLASTLTSMLEDDFNVTVNQGGPLDISARLVDASLNQSIEKSDSRSSAEVSLFDGIDSIGFDEAAPEQDDFSRGTSENPDLWDDPDARILYGTLRSGQKIETEHSLIILGDVNSGAELVAGGDIIVLGTLRGVAHAGAYDETGGGRFIFALDLRPTQLRIGVVISQGSSEKGKRPEVARVDGNLIVVEPYASRNIPGVRRL